MHILIQRKLIFYFSFTAILMKVHSLHVCIEIGERTGVLKQQHRTAWSIKPSPPISLCPPIAQ